MKAIILIYLIFIVVRANSQNDTIYIKQDHLIYRGEVYNKTNNNREKIGKWIIYEINLLEVPFLFECASGYDEKSGMDSHWYTNGNYVYRALKTGEKEETRIIKKERIDTINGSIYTNIDADIIRSKIAPDTYVITGIGTYLKNKKNGLWNYYYGTGEKLKTIDYLNGIPIESFLIYRNDGSVMMRMEKQADSKWLVSKYSEKGVKFETQSGTLEDFKALF